jgi:tRNA A37 threonylcarbamoyladenosine synthetase subunit TsaC/SUA5/YrdC
LPPASSAAQAKAYFAGGGVDVLIDGGTLPPSPASTIVEGGPDGVIKILREGAVPRRELERFFAGAR